MGHLILSNILKTAGTCVIIWLTMAIFENGLYDTFHVIVWGFAETVSGVASLTGVSWGVVLSVAAIALAYIVLNNSAHD
jgi:hypothetical protein